MVEKKEKKNFYCFFILICIYIYILYIDTIDKESFML